MVRIVLSKTIPTELSTHGQNITRIFLLIFLLSAPGFSFYEDDTGRYGTYTNGKLEIECINREHAVEWDIFQVRIENAKILFSKFKF